MTNISQIKVDSDWGQEAARINQNFQNINTDLEKVKSATTKFRGYFTSEAGLKSKYPSPQVGDTAYVGEPYPGIVYDVVTDGTWHNTGKAPDTDSVELQDYAKKAELVELEGQVTLYNVTNEIPLEEGYYTATNARMAVPKSYRKKGLVITYEISANEWVTEQYIAELSTDYAWGYTETNWANFGSGNSVIFLLNYVNNSKDTRKLIPSKLRKEGLIITYKNSENNFIIEQFIRLKGSGFADNEWSIDDNWKQFPDIEKVMASYYSIFGYTSDVRGEVVKYNIEAGRKVNITVKNNSDSKTFGVYIGLIKEDGAMQSFIYDFWDGVSSPNYIHTLSPGEVAEVKDYTLPDYCVGVKIGDNGNPATENGDVSITVGGINSDIDAIKNKLIEQSQKVSDNISNIDKNSKAILENSSLLAKLMPQEARGVVSSIVVGGNFEKENNFGLPLSSKQILEITDFYLSVNKISKIYSDSREYSERSKFDFGIFITSSVLGQEIKNNKTKFTRCEALLYCKEKVFKSNSFNFYSGRGQVTGITRLEYADTTSEYVKKYVVILDNSVLQDSDYLYISANITGLTEYIDKNDFGFTGVKMAFFDSLEEAKSSSIKADWIDVDTKNITIEDVQSEINIDKYGINGSEYNNVKVNKSYLSMVISFIKNKIVNKQNRLLISYNGDSIIGSQLDDVEKSPEYDIGAFPPNMSRMTIARKFFDKYRFSDEDVSFRNLLHADWEKTGFERNGKSLTHFNRPEVYSATDTSSFAQIRVTGYKFFKLVWSNFLGLGYKFNILISKDGEEFKKPSELKIKLPDEVVNDKKTMWVYSICELSTESTYTIKILAVENPQNICLWGCEYWNNPRLDVVVEAFSGSTAKINREDLIDGYYSDFHKPFLIISDLLFINDSSYIKNSDYTIEGWMNDNAYIYDFCRKNGVPVLLFIPHGGTAIFLTEYANGLAEYNKMRKIDIQQKKIIVTPSQSIVNGTDGIHLSNYGINYYFEELGKIFDS